MSHLVHAKCNGASPCYRIKIVGQSATDALTVQLVEHTTGRCARATIS